MSEHTLIPFDEQQMRILNSYRRKEKEQTGEIQRLLADLQAAHESRDATSEALSNTIKERDRLRAELEAARVNEKKVSDLETVKKMLYDGLFVDGAHHKQWYLSMAAEYLGVDVQYEYIDRGIEP